jgi:hypothetical protein
LIGEREFVDSRLPGWLAPCVSFGATLVVAAILSEVGSRAGDAGDLAVMSSVVAVVAWWSRPLMSLTTAIVGWLMFNGFVVNQFGELRWHGATDATRLAVLVTIALTASGARCVQIRMARRALIEDYPLVKSSRSLPPRMPRPRLAAVGRYPITAHIVRRGDPHA